MTTQIPLSVDPNQTFTATIYGDKHNLNLAFTMSWNDIAGYWVMGISDPVTNSPFIENIPLLPNRNLLGQYQYLGIGLAASLLNIGDQSIELPDSTNLGTNFALYWLYTD